MNYEVVGAQILCGDALAALRSLPDGLVDTCVTSPPYYGLRDYGIAGQIGLEQTPEQYIERLVAVFREVRRTLREDGTLWLNIADCYAGSGRGRYGDGTHRRDDTKSGSYRGQTDGILPKQDSGLKAKNLMGIPWRLALALQADGWYLRQDIIWQKPNVMPESVLDRCTRSHEYLFLLSRSPRYYFDAEAIAEDARQCGKRNRRSVWTTPTAGYRGAHFAVFPCELVRPCILAGSRPDGLVLDPFFGSGTIGQVALEEGRRAIGIDLNPDYCRLAYDRMTTAV